MATLSDPTDPANMTPEERLGEISAILAASVLRVCRRSVNPAPSSPAGDVKIPQKSGQISLDSPSKPRPHGQRG